MEYSQVGLIRSQCAILKKYSQESIFKKQTLIGREVVGNEKGKPRKNTVY